MNEKICAMTIRININRNNYGKRDKTKFWHVAFKIISHSVTLHLAFTLKISLFQFAICCDSNVSMLSNLRRIARVLTPIILSKSLLVAVK